MKRWLCLILISQLLLSVSGCGFTDDGFKEPVNFYYPRFEQDYQYGDENSVIVLEPREASGHVGHTEYLLSQYLSGALEETLASPFPSGTRLLSVTQEGGILLVELSDIPATVSDHEFTLGCTCLMLTCLELTDAAEVTILSAEKTMTMSRSDLTLYDDVLVEPEE